MINDLKNIAKHAKPIESDPIGPRPIGPIGPIGPLANLFMHYAFDEWLRRNYPTIQFARYADDAVIHATSLSQAEHVLGAVRERLLECGLELHPEKTKIVYCQDSDRKGTHDCIKFDFLGYTFNIEIKYRVGPSYPIEIT